MVYHNAEFPTYLLLVALAPASQPTPPSFWPGVSDRHASHHPCGKESQITELGQPTVSTGSCSQGFRPAYTTPLQYLPPSRLVWFVIKHPSLYIYSPPACLRVRCISAFYDLSITTTGTQQRNSRDREEGEQAGCMNDPSCNVPESG